MPRRVIASRVTTLSYGRGAGGPLLAPRPPAESAPACGAEVPAVLDGVCDVEGWGAAGGVDARAQPVSTIAVRITNLFIVSVLGVGDGNGMRSSLNGDYQLGTQAAGTLLKIRDHDEARNVRVHHRGGRIL